MYRLLLVALVALAFAVPAYAGPVDPGGAPREFSVFADIQPFPPGPVATIPPPKPPPKLPPPIGNPPPQPVCTPTVCLVP